MNHHFLESGSITSAQGFTAAGIACGLKRSGARDLALLVSDPPATAAGAFTANAFAAAPVLYDRHILAQRQPIRAIVINSGNANACTGPQGAKDVAAMAAAVAARLGTTPRHVLVSSTGRIGVPMPMPTILKGISAALAQLSPDNGHEAAEAIMTTDTRKKSAAVTLELDGCPVTIGGMTKGAGMIAPKLTMAARSAQATMLAYVTTDAAVEADFLQTCLEQSLDQSFNRITVDGDTSTNDSFIALANGSAGNTPVASGSRDAAAFSTAFNALVAHLAREMVLDGEGVTRFVELQVTGAKSDAEARICAEAIANSLLCKTAWFGADPNWGRILDVAGYCGVQVAPHKVALDYGGVPIVRGGMDAGTAAAEQVKAIDKPEIRIDLDLGVGDGRFIIWTCDLSYEYVKINADYRT